MSIVGSVEALDLAPEQEQLCSHWSCQTWAVCGKQKETSDKHPVTVPRFFLGYSDPQTVLSVFSQFHFLTVNH